MRNRGQPPIPPPTDTAAHVFLGIAVTIALVLGFLALASSISNHNSLTAPHHFSIYDLTEQPLLASNMWTNIRYNHTLFNSDQFLLIPAPPSTGGDTIKCLKTGTYTMFFKIQTALNTSVAPPLPLQCGSCLLKYAARATIQYQGLGLFHEIPTSHTFDNNVQLLTTSVIFRVAMNDLIRIQFISPCQHLLLSTYNNNANTSHSVSSLLLIY